MHVRGCWRLNVNFIFWPHCYDRHVVSFLFSWFWGPLHRGFPRAPSVWCGLPYHISSLTLWESAGNCIGGFREPPGSGVAFLTTSGLYCLEFYWQLPWRFPRSPSVGGGLPYHISSLTLWESAGNCIGGFREPPRSGVAFLITSGFYCLEFYWQLLWDPNSTELNNNSTPTRLPTGSLKLNV